MPAGTSNQFPTRPRLLDSGDARGIAFALLAAVGLGLAVAMARYAYEGGTNGLTVASVRSLVLAAVLFVYCRATGRTLGLGGADRRRWPSRPAACNCRIPGSDGRGRSESLCFNAHRRRAGALR